MVTRLVLSMVLVVNTLVGVDPIGLTPGKLESVMEPNMTILALSEDYFRMQQNYIDQYVVTSQNRNYVKKRIDLLVKDGWKLKSQSVDKDGFIRSVMVK
jgi:hypothetical protein